MIEEIISFCGYNSASDMLKAYLNDKQIMSLFEDIVDGPDDAKDFVEEEVKRIAEDFFEWVDRDALIEEAEHRAYQAYRDGDC